MARKVINRKALREANDAAEAAEKNSGEVVEKKKATKRKSKTKDPASIRKILYWSVVNQNGKMIAKYAFNQQKQAKAKAEELNASAKSPTHYVKRHTEEVAE